MSRRPPPPLAWQEDDAGDSAGPYTIRLEEPGRWELVDRGRAVGFYPTRSAARQAATGMRRRRFLKRSFIAYVVVAGASLGCVGAALAMRTEPNPEYPPARAVADRFDQARLEVEAGVLDIHEIDRVFVGIEGGSFEHLGRLKLGLAGVFDGDCFGMVWRPGHRVGGVVMRSIYVTCEPDASLIDQPNPPGLVAESIQPSWDYVLPDPERTRVWFIPAFTVGFGLLLAAGARATALLFAMRR